MEYIQAHSPGNENDSKTEVAVATVATLSQNVFEAPRTEGDIPHSNRASIRIAKSKNSHTSTDVPIPPLRNHPSPSSNPEGYQGMSSSGPNFHLNDLAYTKVICHALKYHDRTVNGLLLGHHPAPDALINIVDAVPLLHRGTNIPPIMTVGLEMVRSSSHIFYSSL